MDLITLDRTVEATTKAAEAQGLDFKYNPTGAQRCYYAPLDQMITVNDEIDVEHYKDDPRRLTGCLAGRALDELGVSFDHTAQMSIYAVLAPLMRDGAVEMTEAAVRFLALVQDAQDNGNTWGMSIEDAKNGVAIEELDDTKAYEVK